MTRRDDPATPGEQPAVAELAGNGTTGTVFAVEPNRPRRVPVGEIADCKLDLLIRGFARLINSEVALLCQGGGKGQPPAVISSWGLGATHEEVARPREGGLVGRAPPMRRAALEPLHPLLDSSLVHATHPPLRYAAAAPVRLPNAVAGRLIAGFVTPPRDRTLTLWTAESYAALMALYLTDPGALDALHARRDGLTGCLTYDGMRHELDREIDRSTRDGLHLSVCVIALDSFQRIDDDLGHPCPNAILALLAGNLRTRVRSYDTLGRYGRHHLIAILPQTRASEARQLAERLRSQLSNPPISSPERPLAVSFGVAQWTPGTPSEELLAAADCALSVSTAHPAPDRDPEARSHRAMTWRAGGQAPQTKTTDGLRN
jgi:diguanylate cyclase (GGDEF)-like protein